MLPREDLDEIRRKKELEFIRGREKLKSQPIKSPDYTSPLDQDVMKIKGGMTEKLEPMKEISGEAFADKIARLRKGGSQALKGASKGLKAIPILGTALGLGAALSSGDAAAAVPLFGDVESLGPEDELEKKLESGTITPEERAILMNRFKK